MTVLNDENQSKIYLYTGCGESFCFQKSFTNSCYSLLNKTHMVYKRAIFRFNH